LVIYYIYVGPQSMEALLDRRYSESQEAGIIAKKTL